MTPKEAEIFLNQKLTELSEHFDHIQILTTWSAEGLTHSLARGAGNWYARQGLAHEFITQDAAQENAHALAKVMPKEPPDDADSWKT